MDELRESPLGRLAQDALDYATQEFVLRSDLNHLVRVRRIQAPEAVILYCARILEALASDAIRRLRQEPSANVFSNLEVLVYLNRLTTATRYWAHALRRLSNRVRHVQGLVGPEEAELSVHFAERWLGWFFCHFSHGPKLCSLTRDRVPLGLADNTELGSLLQSVEALESTSTTAISDTDPSTQQNWSSDWWSAGGVSAVFLRTPILPTVAAEVLLGRKRNAEAFRVLDVGLARFPEDIRLRQLMGLYWSREGNIEQALESLGSLYAHPQTDDETVGIVAAVYKQSWLADRANRVHLEESHRAYRGAWRSSGKKNGWLGINTATTALYLGRWDEAKRWAKEVAELLGRRATTLPNDLRDPSLDFDYWDQVTLAEAQLLLGDPAFRHTYEDAFSRHGGRRDGDIAVSRRQRDEILKSLGLPPDSV